MLIKMKMLRNKKKTLMTMITILKISINNKDKEKIHLYIVRGVDLNKLKDKTHYKVKNKQLLTLKADKILIGH